MVFSLVVLRGPKEDLPFEKNQAKLEDSRLMRKNLEKNVSILEAIFY